MRRAPVAFGYPPLPLLKSLREMPRICHPNLRDMGVTAAASAATPHGHFMMKPEAMDSTNAVIDNVDITAATARRRHGYSIHDFPSTTGE